MKPLAILEKVRWPRKKVCPYCGSEKISIHREASKSRLQCSWCRKSFSATTGTFLHGSHVELGAWFKLIRMMREGGKGFSATQASKTLKLRYATVLSMINRIREAKSDKLLRGLEGILCLAIKP